jgi:hypothetical protein
MAFRVADLRPRLAASVLAMVAIVPFTPAHANDDAPASGAIEALRCKGRVVGAAVGLQSAR